jgi:WD40 repeat protein
MSLPLLGHTKRVSSVRFSCDGKYILSSSDDGTIRQWSTRTFTQLGEPYVISVQACLLGVAYATDGKSFSTYVKGERHIAMHINSVRDLACEGYFLVDGTGGYRGLIGGVTYKGSSPIDIQNGDHVDMRWDG